MSGKKLIHRPWQHIRLPTDPTPEQLRNILEASYMGAFVLPKPQPTGPAKELKYVKSYMLLSEAAGGRRMSADALIGRFKRLAWESTFRKLALWGAILANGGGPLGSIKQWTSDLLSKTDRILDFTEAVVGDYVQRMADSRAILHEKVLYMLQAMALIYSGEDGDTPSDGLLAFLALAANDYIDEWYEEDERELLAHEATLAAFADTARFNHQRDPLVEIIRARLLLSSPIPASNKLSDASRWENLQNEAFGRPLEDHFDLFLLPILLHAGAHWGTFDDSDQVRRPEVNEVTWFSNSTITESEGREFLETLAIDRSGVAAEVRLRSDGIPHAPTMLLKKPLVRCSGDLLVATSPWAVQRQVHTGLWFCLFSAAKRLKLGNDWNPAFGLLFEGWLQHVARVARESSAFTSELHLPTEPGGSDEIEDVVVLGRDAVVLFSAKSRLVKEPVARESLARNAIWDWYRTTLFEAEDKKRGYRAGWVRQLDAKIAKIRAGDYEPEINRKAMVLPVIVMYDDTAESPMLYDLIDDTCVRESLLYQHDSVAPLTICTVGDFENLMAAAAKGHDVVAMMSQKVDSEWRRQRLSTFLFEEIAKQRPTYLRLDRLEEEFNTISSAATRRLFPRGRDDEEE